MCHQVIVQLSHAKRLEVNQPSDPPPTVSFYSHDKKGCWTIYISMPIIYQKIYIYK